MFSRQSQRKPRIGLNMAYKPERNGVQGVSYIFDSYTDSVVEAGGVPDLLPVCNNFDVILEKLDDLDGVVFVGGGDLDPRNDGYMLHPYTRPMAAEREKFDRFAAELATLTERETDPLEKTKIVYGYLHDVVLTEKYNLNCSSLVASLETGVFNCVSATALFNCFAARSGLEVAALETTGHAKSRVKFADSFLDLETTCSSWDRLPDKIRPYSRPRSTTTDGGAILQNVSFERREPNADAGSTTFDAETSTPDAPLGYSYTRTRKPMREIGDVELVATIYYNVGVDFYQKERFEEAIVAYVKAARLAPNNLTILGNLKATLNNWAIQIAMKDEDFERAIQVAEQGLLLDPNFPEYKMNLPIFFHRWVDCLARDNRWDEAKRVEREYLKRFPKPTPR